MFTNKANNIFRKVIETYHILDNVQQAFVNPFPAEENLMEHLLYKKCWIDTVQWHYEDLIREPSIDPKEALELKRKIDISNQDRTDIVEYIDSYFLEKNQDIRPKKNATINTESPAWAIDRLSILALKIYHMQEKALQKNIELSEQKDYQKKLAILLEQQVDLSAAIDQLLEDILQGNKYMKVYKQMKMYKHQNYS